MVRLLAAVFVLCAALTAHAEVFAPPPATRVTTDLSGEWKFEKSNVSEAETPALNDSAWEKVTVPHTWNNKDGQDGGNNYYKGACWYRRHVTVADITGKTAYLRFEGANRTATAYVNGKEIGTHTGGFAAFVFDATAALKAGDNVIAVKVSNADDPDSPPLSGDFTFFGGIYRGVSLIVMPAGPHISPLDFGSPGVRVSLSKVTAESAQIDLDVEVAGDVSKAPSITATLVDAAGNVAATTTKGYEKTNHLTMPVSHPHLWAGKPDPFMYTLYTTVGTDTVSLPVGIRTMVVDPTKGFLLNGKPYDLHGVCRHQDWYDKGWAIGNKEMDADMALFKELGVTVVRLAHYQHAQHFYDLCDKEGIVVWAELPMVNAIGGDKFKENAKQQLTELIRQNQHHPSIAMWSLANEVVYKNDNKKWGDPYVFVGELNEVAKKLDPTRQTVQAIMGNGPKQPVTDIQGFNIYMGWYYGKFDDLPPFIANHSSFAISEYGAGGNPANHSEKPRKDDHTEEFQCTFHEIYWRALRNQPHVWGTFLWAFADFASDGRTEGGFFGRNDKGLVTYDRTIKKDVFYFYKAQWSSDPFVYITSRRFETRKPAKIAVKVYTNQPEAELVVNGVSLGKKKSDMGICLWDAVALKSGENKVEAKATAAGKPVTDAIEWKH